MAQRPPEEWLDEKESMSPCYIRFLRGREKDGKSDLKKGGEKRTNTRPAQTARKTAGINP